MELAPPLTDEAIAVRARDWLAKQRQELRQEFETHQDPDLFLQRHAQAIDRLVGALFALCPGDPQDSFAVIAVGGYGRSELYPYSDIDVFFLHDEGQSEAAADAVRFMLYRLWDMGLAVGQAYRSLEETLALAKSDITVCTNLLDARLVVGKQALFKQFQKRFEAEIMRGSVVEFVEAKLVERDARHLRFGDSRYMLEPHVKEGKGGLRDIHTLWWLARYSQPVATLADFARKKLLGAEEYRTFDQARRFLCRVRIHLHHLAGRAEDRLTFDRQYALAQAMGYPHPSANRAIARFMRRYFVAVRTIGSITRVFCALLEEEKKRKPQKPFGWLKKISWLLGNFRLEGERLHIRYPGAIARNPLLMLELFKTAQMHGLDIHPGALQLIARNLDRVDEAMRRNPKANALFLDILLSPLGPETTLRRMSDAGLLGRFIPDFGRVIGQTQFNMYHVYTVDEHTLVALGYLHMIASGRLRDTVPLASEVIHRIQDKRVLYVALLCHDIAKGRGGDHSALGEKIAEKLSARFGFSRAQIDTVAWLVREHLLFNDTAFKRDLDDPKTIADFVAEVATPERLKLLLVLTVADMSAVRPGVWNAWKGALMRDLYRRAEREMGEGEDDMSARGATQLKAYLSKALPEWDERDIDGYLALGNASFWASLDEASHAAIARMLRQAETMAWPLLIDTQHDYEHSITTVTVCAFDQSGLFSNLAGALALAGANIVGAKIFTLKNAMAVDVFQVQDVAGEVFDRTDKLAKMSVYIEQVLSGAITLSEAFHKRQRAKLRAAGAAQSASGQVFVHNDASNLHTVIEIAGQDRSGFLYSVTRAIADLGLSVVTAHISTYGTQVSDVFYVKDAFGMKIIHAAKIRQIEEKLGEAIGG
jgi:[protein-PII] uridylyltransferase